MDFEDIRSFRDDEVTDALSRISQAPNFWRAVSYAIPDVPPDVMKEQLKRISTIDDFQKIIIYQCLHRLLTKVATSLNTKGITELPNKPTLFITNHRDIIIDSALLCKCLVDAGRQTTEIAIGDNLLIEPWIKDLVRINKSFIVKRGGGIREQLNNSMQLSAYIRHDICERGQNVWIAQREGRAKDSNDRTQESLLKMLALSGEGSLPKRLSELNICPVAISYEFDPCDYLKAMEMQQKRDIEGFKKSMADDLRSMGTGVLGVKGRIMYSTDGLINNEILEVEQQISDKKQQVTAIAQIIDKHIHRNYELYPINYVAYDLLKHSDAMSDHYSQDERQKATEYINAKLAMIDLPNRDDQFLRTKILEMYANPLINYLETTKQ